MPPGMLTMQKTCKPEAKKIALMFLSET